MELKCGATSAVFDLDFGGRLASLCIDGTEVLVTERSGDTQWGCYPMIPWAGHVRNGRFVSEGRTHQLPLNLPPHALHGTVFGAQWSRHEDGTLRCPLGPSWPWPGDARSVVSLEADRLTWRVEVHARDSTFPAVVGWHPWFLRKLADDSVGSLSFEPRAMLSRDAAGIPTGDRASAGFQCASPEAPVRSPRIVGCCCVAFANYLPKIYNHGGFAFWFWRRFGVLGVRASSNFCFLL